IHVLSDPSRGPIIETVLSRMKAIFDHFHTRNGSNSDKRRIISVSATLNNIENISDWLTLKSIKTHYYEFVFYFYDRFNDDYKSVKVNRIVLGYPQKDSTSAFSFDIGLNFKLKHIIQSYSNNKPTLIFCSTRKGTLLAASTLAKDFEFNADDLSIRYK
ncbi:hypothetical protein MXB_843, partial [Myxobolus squamalis]